MEYVKAALSGLAALFIAAFVFAWPLFRESKATGAAAVAALFLESTFSPKFWIIGMVVFALFFVASRGNTFLRVLLFWIPTVTVSTLGCAFLALWAYLVVVLSRHP
jgi:hypothetical protein